MRRNRNGSALFFDEKNKKMCHESKNMYICQTNQKTNQMTQGEILLNDIIVKIKNGERELQKVDYIKTESDYSGEIECDDILIQYTVVIDRVDWDGGCIRDVSEHVEIDHVFVYDNGGDEFMVFPSKEEEIVLINAIS